MPVWGREQKQLSRESAEAGGWEGGRVGEGYLRAQLKAGSTELLGSGAHQKNVSHSKGPRA